MIIIVVYLSLNKGQLSTALRESAIAHCFPGDQTFFCGMATYGHVGARQSRLMVHSAVVHFNFEP